MPSFKTNRFLFRIANWSGWILAGLMLLYFISGYGETKQIIDPVLAKSLHERWLPLPTIIFFVLHTFLHLKFRLKRWLKEEKWLNIYLFVFGLVIFAFLLYLYLL